MVQLGLMVDVGYGVENPYDDVEGVVQTADSDVITGGSSSDDSNWAHLAGAGFLANIQWSENFSSQLSLATPVSSRSNRDEIGEDADSSLFYMDFSFNY